MDKQIPASGSGTVPSPPPPAPSPGATREKLLSWSPRRYSVNRFVLVQQPDETKPRPSTVGVLTKGRHHRALVLYLLLLTWWPWLSLRHTPLAAEVWVRALTAEGPGTANALTWSPSTLSRTWGELGELGLVERKREGRLTRIVPRREDGKDDYVAPAGQKKDWYNAYFTLPHEFWTEQHFATLSPAALAVLLIVLKETTKKPDVELLREKMQDWYGISGKTVTKGIQELMAAGLIEERLRWEEDLSAKLGYVKHHHYGLTGVFSTEERAARRRVARRKRRLNERKKSKKAAQEAKS